MSGGENYLTRYHYNDAGEIISEITYVGGVEDPVMEEYRHEYKYENGKLIQDDYKNGFSVNSLRYSYEGNLISTVSEFTQSPYAGSEFLGTFEYFYDENERLIEKRYAPASESRTASTTFYSYDENGNLIEEVRHNYYTSGERVTREIYEYEAIYENASVPPTIQTAQDFPATIESQSEYTVEETVPLGKGNLVNNGFATGNSNYMFYVTHTSETALATLCQEESTTGKIVNLFSEYCIDSLNLVDNNLYFHTFSTAEKIHSIKQYSLIAGDIRTLYSSTEGIWNLTVYKDYCYFNSLDGLSRCTTQGTGITALISDQEYICAFCIVGDRIYYSLPEEFGTGGFYFGGLYSMTLDGQDQRMILPSVGICNNDGLFSDGDWLYFKHSSFAKCRLDGTELTELYRYYEDFNYANGIIYRGSYSDGVFERTPTGEWRNLFF